MNVVQLLLTVAENNHGRTLEPLQVKELVASFQAVNAQLMTTEGRLDAVTRIAGVMLERLGGTARINPAEFDEFDNSPGFKVSWDEEADVIYVETEAAPEVQEVEVSAMWLEDDDATASGGDSPPLPEGEGLSGPADGPEA